MIFSLGEPNLSHQYVKGKASNFSGVPKARNPWKSKVHVMSSLSGKIMMRMQWTRRGTPKLHRHVSGSHSRCKTPLYWPFAWAFLPLKSKSKKNQGMPDSSRLTGFRFKAEMSILSTFLHRRNIVYVLAITTKWSPIWVYRLVGALSNGFSNLLKHHY